MTLKMAMYDGCVYGEEESWCLSCTVQDADFDGEYNIYNKEV